MGEGRERVREAHLAKARHEVTGLVGRGVVMGGNAFAGVLLAKGEPEAAPDDAPLSGPDGDALRAALGALGYAPEDWAALSTLRRDGTRLEPALFREAVATLDPATLVLLDEAAADLAREAYADELSRLPDFGQAMLAPGEVADVLGMRVLALGGFAAALADRGAKQVMWRRLKSVPPLGEPY